MNVAALTSVGLCATRPSNCFGFDAQATFVLSHTAAVLLTVLSARPADCFTAALVSTLQDCFTAALVIFWSASKRLSICCTGVMCTFFFFLSDKQFDFIACQHSAHTILQLQLIIYCVHIKKTHNAYHVFDLLLNKTQWDWSLIFEPVFLQCFDTVGWVIWAIKLVPDMTCNVFGGTLNFTQLQLLNTISVVTLVKCSILPMSYFRLCVYTHL